MNCSQELTEADLILLLISVDFMYSDLCMEHILKVAMQKNKEGSAWVVPIYVRPCKCDETLFEGLQPLPNAPNKPDYVTEWERRDSAWLNVVNGIEKVMKA